MRHLSLAAALAALLSTSAMASPPQAVQAPATNPLIAPWTGPYGGVPPWDKVKPEEHAAEVLQEILQAE